MNDDQTKTRKHLDAAADAIQSALPILERSAAQIHAVHAEMGRSVAGLAGLIKRQRGMQMAHTALRADCAAAMERDLDTMIALQRALRSRYEAMRAGRLADAAE